jgi:Rod binding domain-containing protein
MTTGALTSATTQPFERPALSTRRMRGLDESDLVGSGRVFGLPKHHSTSTPFSAEDLQPLGPLDPLDAQFSLPKLRPLNADDFIGIGAAKDFQAAPRALSPLTPNDFTPGGKLPQGERPLEADDFIPGVRKTADSGDVHARLTRQAQKWVAQTFYGPMFKQMRESPFKSDLFAGGRGGEMFSQLQDQQLADRMSRGAGNKLVRSIVRRMEAKIAYRKQQSFERSKEAPGSKQQQPKQNTMPAAPLPQLRPPRESSREPQGEGRFKDVKIHVAPAFGA